MSEQRTEKPTPRRLEKARKEGRAAISTEFLVALQLTALYYAGRWWSENFLEPGMISLKRLVQTAFSSPLSVRSLELLYQQVLLAIFLPLGTVGLGLLALTLVFQVGIVQAPISMDRLAPKMDRFNVVQRLTSLPKQNLSGFGKSLLIVALFLIISYPFLRDHLPELLATATQPLPVGLAVLGSATSSLVFRLVAAALLVGLIDFGYQKWQFQSSMKMTKQEVRDESKDSEGRPEVKMQMRRMRREMRRKRMMREVPKATFVVVNPTHYAVAIRYQMDSMAAPMVVAKGKNFLAQRIRGLATFHQIPIIENPPLARALYKSAEVGQEIPVDLYQAVAEILAYIYRLLNGRLPG